MTLRDLMNSFPVALPEMLWAGIAVIATVSYFWALIDAATRPAHDWRRAGMSKILWVFGILVFPWAGLLFYVVVARPRFATVQGQPE